MRSIQEVEELATTSLEMCIGLLNTRHVGAIQTCLKPTALTIATRTY